MSHQVSILPFEPTQEAYVALADLDRAVWPDSPMTAALFKHRDDVRDPQYLFQRLVVPRNDAPVAFAEYGETPWSFQPGKYSVSIVVHPDHERCGIGTALYDHVLAALSRQQHEPVLLVSGTRENKPQAIRFLERRGFQPVMRWIISELDLAAFDPSPWVGLQEKVQGQGVRFLSLSELMERDSTWQHKLWDLDWALTLDEPSPAPPTRLPLERFVQQRLAGPEFLPEGEFVALEGERYVGMSGLSNNPADPQQLWSGFTGVVRSHRRRGIATALKLQTIDYARRAGARSIRTGNEDNNPMYLINVRLGFEKATASLAYEKPVGNAS
jgi:GNAT superfamily N-acetyltransferase